MANEAVCIETPTIFARRVIAAGAVLPFGTIMKLTDPNTGVATSADNDPFGGIVWERVSTATSTHTEITVAMNGVWDLTATAATINIGIPVAIGAANKIRAAVEADTVLGNIMAQAEEAASNDEVIRCRVGVFA